MWVNTWVHFSKVMYFFQRCCFNIAGMVSFNHNIMLLAQNVWKRYFLIMTGERNLWSDIKWNQQGMFACGEQYSALQFWRSNEMSPTLTDTRSDSKRQGIIYHSSSDIFWALDKQVHHRDPRGKSLTSRTNPLSLPIHIKTLWIAQEDSGGYVTWKCDMAYCYGSVPEEL